MKRFILLLKKTALLALATVALSNCSNSSSSDAMAAALIFNQYYSRAALSRKAYIGGSLIYNPNNSSLSQLAYGIKIAVRTSKLKKETASLKLVSSETISVDARGTASGLGTSESFSDYIYEVDGSEVFGYITITGLTKDAVSFIYSYYPSENSGLSSQACSLKLGESKKLGLSNSEIKYETPHIARKGFENASWLTFVNSEDSLTACMFSAMPEANGKPLGSIYGVNTADDFIYIVGDRNDSDTDFRTSMPAQSDMVSYGDYVIDQNDSKIYAVAGDPSSGYQSALKDIDSHSDSHADYTYKLYQFPDRDNGPKALFEALPQSVQTRVTTCSQISGTSSADYIRKLNWMFYDGESFTLIEADLRAKGKTALADSLNTTVTTAYASINQTWDDWIDSDTEDTTYDQLDLDNRSHLKGMRNFLDDLYGESPDAYVDAPTLFNVYPDIALDLGGNQDAPDDYAALNVIPTIEDAQAFKSFEKGKNYLEYVSKRAEIIKKFKDYHQLNLAKINGSALNQYGVNLALGVKGSLVKNLGIKSGEFGVKGLGAAIFLKAEASMQNLDMGDHSFLTDEQKQKLVKNVHEPITFSIGPVPFVYETTFNFDFGWKLNIQTNIQYFAGITALCGGQVDLGAKWGVKFTGIIPTGGYFDTWPTNAKTVDDAVFYVGPSLGAANIPRGLDFGIYISGTLSPSLGVGFKYISTGLQVPATVKPEIHLVVDEKFLSQYNTLTHLKALLGLKITMGPYFKVVIPIINKKLTTNWTAFTILDKGDGNAIELFDEPLTF
ncbi:MAG: hypothetical protein K6A42_03550 [Treponema sp.]|nr:hypothetical protein [Treponema sp.]